MSKPIAWGPIIGISAIVLVFCVIAIGRCQVADHANRRAEHPPPAGSIASSPDDVSRRLDAERPPGAAVVSIVARGVRPDGSLDASGSVDFRFEPRDAGAGPRCTVSAIWKRARIDGAYPGGIAEIELDGGTWRFEVLDPPFQRTYPDDCH